MGNSAVAVLHYDHTDEIMKLAPRLGRAMLGFATSFDPRLHGDFGFGRVVSFDHSDGYQVCVIHGNTGWPILADNAIPDDVLNAVAESLRRRGWKCTKPKETA